MNENDLIALAICAPVIALGIGFLIGGRQERAYWADHADNGDVHYRGDFYRVTKLPRAKPGRPLTTGEPPTNGRHPKPPTR